MPVTGTNTHPGGRLVDVFHHPVLTGSEHLAPDRMMLGKHRKPPGGMDRFFPGLIPAILDDGDHVEPRPVLISIPRGNAMRLRLLNNSAQHMLQQSIRLGLAGKRRERAGQRLDLATSKVF